jgi:hypothetical protein
VFIIQSVADADQEIEKTLMIQAMWVTIITIMDIVKAKILLAYPKIFIRENRMVV